SETVQYRVALEAAVKRPSTVRSPSRRSRIPSSGVSPSKASRTSPVTASGAGPSDMSSSPATSDDAVGPVPVLAYAQLPGRVARALAQATVGPSGRNDLECAAGEGARFAGGEVDAQDVAMGGALLGEDLQLLLVLLAEGLSGALIDLLGLDDDAGGLG